MADVWGPERRLGCIGAGRMARGVLEGAMLTGKIQAKDVTVSAPSDTNVKIFCDHGCHTTHSNADVLTACKVVILAVKPHIISTVLQEISSLVTCDHVFISLAAGVTLQTLENCLPAGSKVLRMSPNLPCVVQEGAVVVCRGRRAGEQEVAMVKSLFSGCGLCEEVPESYIDIHTGLSGSGVAYVYMFAEALADGAVKMGMPSELSNRIAAQTLLGAAKMLLKTGDHPAKLRSDVCTPGGTTICALHELEKGGLRATVMNAVETATEKARSIGKKQAQ
ncbi:pyrroline-5-carboxylate reductase 3 [Pelobates fuscus]|uniref:pyrroline-5-carboxylate reductase 3 n=1 Tax=Pelobates fuscus TaxID=191477 RepID=UPI002FE4F700